MKLRLILLFLTLTCLQASQSLECPSATEKEKDRRLFFFESLPCLQKAAHASSWAFAQSSLDETIRMACDAPLEPLRSQEFLDTTLRTAFQDIMKQKNLSEASTLCELRDIAQLVSKILVKVYKKKHPIISEAMTLKQVGDMLNTNFRLDLTIYFHAFAFLEQNYALSQCNAPSDDEKSRTKYYQLLSSFKFFAKVFSYHLRCAILYGSKRCLTSSMLSDREKGVLRGGAS
ncbi:MAG: hypothetical protein OXC30_00630 [Alphaproteobacteria bacterium]|nr:hypothetical protein [Alphaproteobacteria bacterium]